MKKNPILKIEIQSHSDARGSEAYNYRLSKKRSKTTVEYLLSQGVTSSRISSKDFGETQLVNDCKLAKKCSDKKHGLNRRSKIIVIE